MATTFPTNPTVGQVFVSGTKSFEWDGTAWRAKTSGVQTTGASLIPSGNEQQDLGSPTNRYKDLYLSANSLHLGDTVLTEASLGDLGGGATTVYATTSLLPRTGIDAGATAFVTETSRFYIWNGVGWFNVAVVNNTPTITNAPAATYNLFANGSPTIITLAATDVDGDTLTWSYSAPDASGKATITQADNVFTITPLTDIADTSFTIDFEVTDGINISTASSTVNIDNRSPVIDTAPSATYALATDGSPTIITLAATDPDGGSITWTYADSGLTDQATIVQNGNEFTITPNSTPAVYADFTLTFTASDSIESTSTSPTTLSLTFILLADEWSDTVLSIGTSSTNSLDNSTFIDRSTNASTVTTSGAPIQTAFHPYLDNWSVEFDGSGDHLQTNSSESLSGDFTIECWVRHTDNGATANPSQRIFCTTTGGNISTNLQLIIANSTGAGLTNGAPYLYTNGFLSISSESITDKGWHHLAVTRSSGDIKLFVNGVQKGNTVTNNTSLSLTNSRIGTRDSGTDNDNFSGNISDLRVVNGTALYTSNFTPPTEKLTAVSGTSLLTCQSNRFIDNSTNGHAITVNGNPKVSAFNPFGQGSEYAVGENKGSVSLNGTNSGLFTGQTSDLTMGTGDFTIEAWIYVETLGGLRTICDTRSAYGSEAITFELNNDTLTFFAGSHSPNVAVASSSGIKINQWHHVAFARSSGTNYLFIDGNQVATNTNSFNQTLNTNVNFTIGYSTAQGRWVDGFISDLKVTKGTALYTSSFTPPTSPVGNTNASLYLPMDNAGIFDKTGNHTLSLVNQLTSSTTQTKFADTAIKFDGQDDYIGISDIGSLNADFTIETWVYIPSTGSVRTIVSRDFGSAGGFLFWNQAGTLRFRGYNSSGGEQINMELGTETISENVWTHVAVTRSGSTIRTFVNGVLDQTGTGSTSLVPMNSTGELQIGVYSTTSGDFIGWMEDFQILNYAKYTTNFTPPIGTQGRSYQQTS